MDIDEMMTKLIQQQFHNLTCKVKRGILTSIIIKVTLASNEFVVMAFFSGTVIILSLTKFYFILYV